MKIVVPLAGRGSRYADRGFEIPKPLIQVAGKPMLLWALEGLKALSSKNYYFVLLKEHEEKFHVKLMLHQHLGFEPTCVLIDEITEGQLCTVLKLRDYIDADEDILIAAADTLVKDGMQKIAEKKWDGLISVSDLPGDRWSFAKTDSEGKVIQVTEKIKISDHASTGLYYFRKGNEFVRIGEKMIANQEKTRGEYFVMPVYQKMIDRGMRIGISVATEMWDMGTPEAKELFEKRFSV